MTTTEAEVTSATPVYTKEELDALRRQLAARNFESGGESRPPEDEPNAADSSDADVLALIAFLTGLVRLLETLVERRIPDPPRARFQSLLTGVRHQVGNAIEELNTIDSRRHPLYRALERLGMAGEALGAKLEEYRDTIGRAPVLAVLKMADKIMGSLVKVLTQLEPVKEYKELVEHRIEYGPDAEIQTLGL